MNRVEFDEELALTYNLSRQLERERDELREALSGRTVSCSRCNEAGYKLVGFEAEVAGLRAENEDLREAIRVSLIRAYTAGYRHGHEATVEGGFIPVHHSDETEFHAENIHQMLCDGSLPEIQPFITL